MTWPVPRVKTKGWDQGLLGMCEGEMRKGMKQFAKASKDAATYISGGGAAPVADAAADDDEDDEDVDLFGSDEDDEDDEAKAKVVEERLKAYHAKKAKKPALIAKTSVLLDVKP